MSELEAALWRLESAKAIQVVASERVTRALEWEIQCDNEVTKARMTLVAIQDALSYEI